MERLGVPVHANVPLETALAARATLRGDLRLACCRSCGFVTNLAFEEELLRDGKDHEAPSTHSQALEKHTESLIGALIEAGCREKFVLEIGCGQGTFLRRLCAEGANRGVGFDPAYRGAESVVAGGVSFKREFFCGQRTDESPYLVLCRHVIDHVSDPTRLLKDVVDSLGRERGARIAFELPSVDWVLDQSMFQDFCYERPSYFSAASARFAFEHAGFTEVELTPTFGGQYLWATAEHPLRRRRAPARPSPDDVMKAIARHLLCEPASRAAARLKLEGLNATGPVAIWGAGAKGVTFLNLVDPRCELVDCAVDTNPSKQGKFVAGTGHPIVSPADLARRGVRHALVMNPNRVEEAMRAASATSPDVTIGEWTAFDRTPRERAPAVRSGTAAADASAEHDPIHVFRAALAERASWDRLFLEARLTPKEIENLRHAIARARGLAAHGDSKDDRALDRLLEGRADWFEGLLRDPATVPSSLRAALAKFAAEIH
jgi:SAM-dependent methyltransferase